MKRSKAQRNVRTSIVVLAGLMLGTIAYAQDGFPPPPPDGQGRMGLPGGPGRRPMGPPPLNLARIPVTILAQAIGLSSTQKTKVADIQKALRPTGRQGGPGMDGFGGPPPGGPGFGSGGGPDGPPPPGGPDGFPGRPGFGSDGGPGGPPPPGGPDEGPGGPGRPRGARMIMSPADAKASKQIEQILTEEQRKLVPGFLKDVRTLGPVGLPLPVLTRLELTSDQWATLHGILSKVQFDPRREAPPEGGEDPLRKVHDQVMNVLTDQQRATAREFARRVRRPGFNPPAPDSIPPPPVGGN